MLYTTLGFFQQQNHQSQHLVLVTYKTVIKKKTQKTSFLYKVSLLRVFQYNSEMLTSTLPTNTIACKDILTDLILISKHTYPQI